MGDIDASSTAAPSTVPAPPKIVDGIIGNTPSAPDASEPGSGSSGEPCADVKTEKAAEGAPAARLPLKQAVELEMKNLSDATERIDADTAFMHYLIDRRREYLIETLQKLKYNRDMSTQNEINRYKYLIGISRGNARRLKGITSETPLRALRLLPRAQHTISAGLRYANMRALDNEYNECSTVLMYTGLNRERASNDVNCLWKRDRTRFLTDLSQCEVSVTFAETTLTAGVSCPLTATVGCGGGSGSRVNAVELVARCDEDPGVAVDVDGKWKRVREDGNEMQVLNAKVVFPRPGNYTLYAQVSFGEPVCVKSFTVEPALKHNKGNMESLN